MSQDYAPEHGWKGPDEMAVSLSEPNDKISQQLHVVNKFTHQFPQGPVEKRGSKNAMLHASVHP
jgi:hypothetical protein